MDAQYFQKFSVNGCTCVTDVCSFYILNECMYMSHRFLFFLPNKDVENKRNKTHQPEEAPEAGVL